MHIRNQLITPNLRGKGVISLYHMNSYLFKQQYAKSHVKILILEVDFDQYFLSECSIQNNIHLEILVKINPKNWYFFMKYCTLLYKHIINHIAKRNYDFVPKIWVYRLISLKKLISQNQVDFSF